MSSKTLPLMSDADILPASGLQGARPLSTPGRHGPGSQLSCIPVVRRRCLALCADERREGPAIGWIVGDGVITNSNGATKEMLDNLN